MVILCNIEIINHLVRWNKILWCFCDVPIIWHFSSFPAGKPDGKANHIVKKIGKVLNNLYLAIRKILFKKENGLLKIHDVLLLTRMYRVVSISLEPSRMLPGCGQRFRRHDVKGHQPGGWLWKREPFAEFDQLKLPPSWTWEIPRLLGMLTSDVFGCCSMFTLL